MNLLLKQQHSNFLAVLGNFFFVTNIHCGLQPYYIHFPPPVIPVPNGLAPIDFSYSPWPSNSTRTRNNPSGPIPLIVHTWVKPETSNQVKLENGTIIYYVAPPWGGIRSSAPTSSSPQAATPSNSLSESDDFSSGGKEIERQSLFENPNRQHGYPNSVSIVPQNIDITTPHPDRQAGSPWGHGHLGFGWSTATQLYDKVPETSTGITPTGNPSTINSNPTTTPEVRNRAKTTTTLKTTTRSSTTETATTTGSTTTTADPVAANTNARFPVSDSVRKFRRIVAQIRAITKKELAAPKS